MSRPASPSSGLKPQFWGKSPNDELFQVRQQRLVGENRVLSFNR